MRTWIQAASGTTAIAASSDAQVLAETDFVSLGHNWKLHFAGMNAVLTSSDATGNLTLVTATIGFRFFAADGVTNFSTFLPVSYVGGPGPIIIPKTAGGSICIAQHDEFSVDSQSIFPIAALWTQFTMRATAVFRNADAGAAHNASVLLKGRYDYFTMTEPAGR